MVPVEKENKPIPHFSFCLLSVSHHVYFPNSFQSLFHWYGKVNWKDNASILLMRIFMSLVCFFSSSFKKGSVNTENYEANKTKLCTVL